LSIGDPDVIVPLRSVGKPFMLTPILCECEKAGIRLSDAQICIMASSHNGEKRHRDIIESILLLSNSTANDMNCGTHMPYYQWLIPEYINGDEGQKQLYHNCSGKHAGMLLIGELMSVDRDRYWLPEHPIQQRITSSVREMLQIGENDYFHIAIDGCGSPTYCITLSKLAAAYCDIWYNKAMNPVTDAVMKEPFFIAGSNRIDTVIIDKLKFFAKSGTDGLFCISCPKQQIGIALKVESGNDDVSESAIVEILNALGLLDDYSRNVLDEYWHLKIYTTTGIAIGEYRPIREVF